MKILTKKIGVSITLSREYNSCRISEEVEIEYVTGEEAQLEQLKVDMKEKIKAEVKREIDAISGLMKQPFNPNPNPVLPDLPPNPNPPHNLIQHTEEAQSTQIQLPQ